MVKYSQALRALRDLVVKVGRNPKDFALNSLRIGGASTLAAGVDISERVTEREGRRTSETYTTYTRDNTIGKIRLECLNKVADKEKGVKRQPGGGTVCGSSTRRR